VLPTGSFHSTYWKLNWKRLNGGVGINVIRMIFPGLWRKMVHAIKRWEVRALSNSMLQCMLRKWFITWGNNFEIRATHKCVVEQQALVTVFETSVEFAYPSRRRGMQLHLSRKQLPKQVAQQRTSEFASSKIVSECNESLCSMHCIIFHSLSVRKIIITSKSNP